jgi:hypothetical protein
LDQHEWWLLKGICAKISVKLYTKFKDDYMFSTIRATDKKNKDVADKKVLARFIEEFKDQHLKNLCNAHLQVVLSSG